MKNTLMKNKVELLAPASSLESVIAAVNSGCDAIYIGGRAFNARAFADSPDNTGLKEIIDICRLRGVKVFITLNTLYKTSELGELLDFARFLYEAGADAFIVQDIGFFLLAEKLFPDIELHCSTQMTIHNAKAARFFDKLGADRVVLSRELMLDEIKDITSQIRCDTECFVHGALCVCYSGRCLMSSIFGGRSGNRGRCAQPCRMEYTLLKDGKPEKRGYLISPKDICTVEMTDKLIDAGIYSFKIEGRMKSPEYAAETVSAYRKAIDGSRLTRPELDDLKQIFNRGGSFSNGYYTQFAGSNMISPSPKSSGIKIGSVVSASKNGCMIKTQIPLHCGDGVEIWNKNRENTGSGISAEYSAGDIIKLNVYGEKGAPVYRSYSKELNDRLHKASEKLTRQSVLKAEFYAHIGVPMKLTVYAGETPLVFEGSEPQKADKKPMTAEDIISRLKKTGGTPFIFDFAKTDIEEGIFAPVSELNRLRREACEKAESVIKASFERRFTGDISLKSLLPEKNRLTKPQKLTVFVEHPETAEAVLPHRPHRIYAELNADTCDGIIKLIKKAHDTDTEVYAALPRIERNEYSRDLEPLIKKLEESGIDGWLLRNYGSMDTDKPVMYDYCFNAANPVSADFFGNVTLSPELTCREQAEIAGDGRETVAYGHLVLMSTHQCPIGNSTGEKSGKFCPLRKKGGYSLKDRTGAVLPIMTHCQSCTAFILNNAPLYTAHRFRDIAAIGSEFIRLDFTIEDNKTAGAVTKTYADLLRGGEIPAPPDFPYTSGHFFKGVQ
ncbi:MAG: U32 family peptidase [Firmicutes bacterium]|nr:U32 family peptidase [Bacillota bacterium]